MRACKNSKLQRLGAAPNNEELVDLDVRETSEQALDQGKLKIIQALETNTPAGKTDLNNRQLPDHQELFDGKRPARTGSEADKRYTAQAQAMVDYREKFAGRCAEFRWTNCKVLRAWTRRW